MEEIGHGRFMTAIDADAFSSDVDDYVLEIFLRYKNAYILCDGNLDGN